MAMLVQLLCSLKKLILAMTGHKACHIVGHAPWHPATQYSTFLCPTTRVALCRSPKAYLSQGQKMSVCYMKISILEK